MLLKRIRDAADSENEVTRNYAVSLAAKSEGNFNIDQVCEIYDQVFDNWKYVNDPKGSEYFSKASNSINVRLKGDCDDFAILMASLIQSVGGTVRINLASGTTGGHAFAEVYLNEAPENVRKKLDRHYKNFFQKLFGISKVEGIYYRNDPKGGIWLNLDWSSKYPGGDYFDYTECTAYYPWENYYETIE